MIPPPKLTFSQTVRISEEMESELTSASNKMEIAKQDTIRLCIALGLKYLKRIKYDLSDTILNAAEDNVNLKKKR